MSGKVVLGIGIGALAGAAIFGAGFWIARRAMPFPGRPELGLRVMMPGDQPGRGEEPGETPFGRGMHGWMGPGGPGVLVQPGPFGHMGRGFATSSEPPTADQARQAVDSFLDSSGETGLSVGEVLVFENHAYAVVEKAATGQGAFEVLVEGPGLVHLEFGPGMMWNTEYGMLAVAGHMAGHGPMLGLAPPDPSVEPSVTADHAAEIARAYLAGAHPGTVLGDVLAFPGYFTVHFEKDGTFAGMLSVNAYTGQVWEHTWHGKLIESSE